MPPIKTRFKKGDPRQRELGRKGGQAKTLKKAISSTMNLARTPSWHKKNMTRQQIHMVQLLKEGNFKQAIMDLVIQIASETKELEDKHKLLTQMMKLPFVAKILADYESKQQAEAIPIIIEVIREHGQEQLIKPIYDRLLAEGVFATQTENAGVIEVSAMRGSEERQKP